MALFGAATGGSCGAVADAEEKACISDISSEIRA
jgi:hypothetical protein